MRPMLATPAPVPVGSEWVYEVKWDGMRILAEVAASGLRTLTSRNGNDVTASFPELAGLGELDRPALLDGEVVAFDADGRVSFERLTERIGVGRGPRAAALAKANPVTYVIFDLLSLDGRSLTAAPFREWRAALQGLQLLEGPFIVPEMFDDGPALLVVTAERGLEGVIAKRWDAPYQPGRRSRAWIKQSHRDTTDAVVIGWRGAVASLALATRAPDGELVYRGTAGSGISQAMAVVLGTSLRQAADPPQTKNLADDAERLTAEGFRWARPRAVVEITHLGTTAAGRFRQPVVVRVRPDLDDPAPTRPEGDPITVAIGGRQLRVAHLDKVLYPASGTTKAEVIEYCATVAPHLLRLAADRPITRRRWPDGVAAGSFFEKNLPTWAPDWIRRVEVPTTKEPTVFPVLGADDVAALIWRSRRTPRWSCSTPEWTVDPTARSRRRTDWSSTWIPDPASGWPNVAGRAAGAGAREPDSELDGPCGAVRQQGPAPVRPVAGALERRGRGHRPGPPIAEQVRAQAPDLVVVTMAKQARVGRVFLDRSQNRAAKTTLAPWSLRGIPVPNVAPPITWDEVASGEPASDRGARGTAPPVGGVGAAALVSQRARSRRRNPTNPTTVSSKVNSVIHTSPL